MGKLRLLRAEVASAMQPPDRLRTTGIGQPKAPRRRGPRDRGASWRPSPLTAKKGRARPEEVGENSANASARRCISSSRGRAALRSYLRGSAVINPEEYESRPRKTAPHDTIGEAAGEGKGSFVVQAESAIAEGTAPRAYDACTISSSSSKASMAISRNTWQRKRADTASIAEGPPKGEQTPAVIMNPDRRHDGRQSDASGSVRLSHFGALVTDFNLIKAGTKANGAISIDAHSFPRSRSRGISVPTVSRRLHSTTSLDSNIC